MEANLHTFSRNTPKFQSPILHRCRSPHFLNSTPTPSFCNVIKLINSPLHRIFGAQTCLKSWGCQRRIFSVESSESFPSSVGEGKESVSPVYVPTPSNLQLRTPHSTILMEARGIFLKKLSRSEELQHGPRFTGAGAQILGADDKYICQYTDESPNFWASRNGLILGNTFISKKDVQPPCKEVPPKEFDNSVLEGYQVTPLWHQGFIRDDGRTNYAETVKTCRWEYSTRPVYGWGNVGSKQKSTAGWLAAFPVFEPHWQVCMASGLSTGWIEWEDERYEFKNAPAYCEKNWGGAFPRKWFWLQCNVYEGANGQVALTAGGGLRQLPGLSENFENAALIGLHLGGVFYEFAPWNGVVSWEIAPWNGVVSWEIAPWGYWQIAAENGKYKVELEATTKNPGTILRAPTTEAGLAPACRETCWGDLRLKLWEQRCDSTKGKLILDVTSNMAVVEVGGGPWLDTWKGKTRTPEIIKHALNLPIDVEQLFDFVPLLKPPGL